MTVINDRRVRRTRASAIRTDPTRVLARDPGNRHPWPARGTNYPRAAAADESTRPGVTRLRPRPAASEVPEQLPLAVGFGSTGCLPPSTLWVVPGLPGDLVALPALLDDEWPADGSSASTRHGVEVESARIVRLDPVAIDPGFRESRSRRSSSAIDGETAPLHLTARGRAALLVAAAAVGVVVVVFAWFGAASSSAQVRGAEPAQVTVHDGDTLWSIAGQVAPNRDPRAVVASLLQLNHLRTPTLLPGQVLRTR